MKRLMKVRLINWHRFLDETIEIGDSVLLSGENGAGKSTLLDALQFVITASKNNFNKAAHENGKRKLSGYVRCKTGIENRPYERTGKITAHVALEFYDEAKKNSFVIGAVVDSMTEDSENCIWYRMEKEVLKDEYFIEGNRPRNISNFRLFNQKRLAMTSKVQRDVRRDYKGRFGRLEDKFFELIPKSLAFKPISDIKDFVYSYVLDQKEVNIESLRENVRTFKELEILLQTTKKKLELLSGIIDKHKAVVYCQEKERFYEYFLTRMDVEISKEEEIRISKYLEKIGRQLENLKQSLNRITGQRRERQNLVETLFAELSGSESFRLENQLKKEIEMLEEQIRLFSADVKKLKLSIGTAYQSAERLLKELTEEQSLRNFIQAFKKDGSVAEFTAARDAVDAVISLKKRESRKCSEAIFTENEKKRNLDLKIRENALKIDNLSRKQLEYDGNVMELKSAIEKEFAKLQRPGMVRILCQLLNITDESWRNAVEGYLNRQKFYLLVEPEDFDVAVSVYERLRKRKKLYGAGIINAKGLEKYETAEEGSLASMVSSENIHAKRYVNMIMGTVMLCGRPEQLKMYRKSITRECMRYQNQVVSVLHPNTYKVPYIGQEAYRIQLEQAKELQKELLFEQDVSVKKLSCLEDRMKLLNREAEVEIRYRLDRMENYLNLQQRKKQLSEEVKKIRTDDAYLLKQQQYDEMKKECGRLEEQMGKIQNEIGEKQGRILDFQEHLNRITENRETLLESLSALEDQLEGELPSLCEKFDSILGSRSNQELKVNYTNTRKGNQTKMETAIRELYEAMGRYKSSFEMGAEISLDGYVKFENLYLYLRDSQLLSYESKVTEAKKAAETEFKEQFLSRLQENIKQARAEFVRLNRALEEIPFGDDHYRFEYFGSRKYREYYDMIMDDFNIGEGLSLLSGQFHQRHEKVIDELFEKLTIDDEGGKILDEFTDYRTYMDYDIRITHSDGNYYYYSRVSEEKSGGETQTPFYVTVAASFMQLYSGAIGGDSIGLILMDEAFNNMDDERISGVLEFFRKLPLQMIVAAPPDKIQYIQPSVGHTLLVLKEGGTSFVEKFDYERAEI